MPCRSGRSVSDRTGPRINKNDPCQEKLSITHPSRGRRPNVIRSARRMPRVAHPNDRLDLRANVARNRRRRAGDPLIRIPAAAERVVDDLRSLPHRVRACQSTLNTDVSSLSHLPSRGSFHPTLVEGRDIPANTPPARPPRPDMCSQTHLPGS